MAVALGAAYRQAQPNLSEGIGALHGVTHAEFFLVGAAFLIVCDLLARTLHPPTEIRLGIITAAFGAPFFLYLLRQYRKEIGYL